MRLEVVDVPTALPISLASVKKFCRITHDLEDDLLTTMLEGAITEWEDYTLVKLRLETHAMYTSELKDGLKLPLAPVSEIVTIEVMDQDGSYVEVDSSKYYMYKEYGIARIAIDTVPAYKYHREAVKVTFKVGYESGKVPKDIEGWVKTRVNTLNEHREEFVIGTIVAQMPNRFIDGIKERYKMKGLR